MTVTITRQHDLFSTPGEGILSASHRILEMEVPPTVNAAVVVEALGEEVMDDKPLDLAALRARREERFQQRRAIIEADPTLTDAQRAVLLNRTLISTAGQATVMGVSAQRVSLMRTARRVHGQEPPHPSVAPEMDEPVAYVAGVADPGVELGRLVEWLEQRGTHLLRPDGEIAERPDADRDAVAAVQHLLERLGEYRPGARRATRTTRSKKSRQPGGQHIPGEPDDD
jgi:hypothetical protein